MVLRYVKNKQLRARCQMLTPVILPTWEAEMERKRQPKQNGLEV
jgi:hypothetical protein